MLYLACIDKVSFGTHWELGFLATSLNHNKTKQYIYIGHWYTLSFCSNVISPIVCSYITHYYSMLYGDIPYVLDTLIGDVMWHCLFIDVCLCIEDSYFEDVYCFRSCVNMYCEGSLRHWCKLFLLQCQLLRVWMDFCVCT